MTPIVESQSPNQQPVVALASSFLQQLNTSAFHSVSGTGLRSGVAFFKPMRSPTTHHLALKPVDASEAFANRLFRELKIPMPGFEIFELQHITQRIQDILKAHTSSKPVWKTALNLNSAQFICMEKLEGNSLKHSQRDDIVNTLQEEKNQKTLGRIMAMDILLHYGDRIIPYNKNMQANGDNLFISEGCLIAIDQDIDLHDKDNRFLDHQKLEQIAHHLKMAITALGKEHQGDADGFYQLYLKPLLLNAEKIQNEKEVDDVLSRVLNQSQITYKDFRNRVSEGFNDILKQYIELLQQKDLKEFGGYEPILSEQYKTKMLEFLQSHFNQSTDHQQDQ